MAELILGGAQFGLHYGVSNTQSSQINFSEAEQIISYAKLKGVTKIDTANAYGNSETIIGKILCNQAIEDFNLITKTPPFFLFDFISTEQIKCVEKAFFDSLSHLKQKKIYALMVHHADDLLKPGGEDLYALISNFKKKGLVNKIGCSFYNRAQMEMVLAKFSLDLVQVPVSIFDQRLLSNNYLKNLSRYLEIHVRSIFLQGLLFLNETQLPRNISSIAGIYLKKINDICQQLGFSAIELALAFFKDKNYLKLVTGVTSKRELAEIISTIEKITNLTLPSIDYGAFAVEDPVMLTPSLWEK